MPEPPSTLQAAPKLESHWPPRAQICDAENPKRNWGTVLKTKCAQETVDLAEAKGRRMRRGDSGSGTSLPAPAVSVPSCEPPGGAPCWGEAPRAPWCAAPTPRQPRGRSPPTPEPLPSDGGARAAPFAYSREHRAACNFLS